MAAPAGVRCTISPIINIPQFYTPPQITSVRHATKKAGGSSNNGRDSAGRRLGIKVWPGTMAKPGSIIVRQRGKKFLVGEFSNSSGTVLPPQNMYKPYMDLHCKKDPFRFRSYRHINRHPVTFI